jgi:hypothetical protein
MGQHVERQTARASGLFLRNRLDCDRMAAAEDQATHLGVRQFTPQNVVLAILGEGERLSTSWELTR